jgi:hypothetical protein
MLAKSFGHYAKKTSPALVDSGIETPHYQKDNERSEIRTRAVSHHGFEHFCKAFA